MPTQTEAIPSARVKPFLIPFNGTDTVPLGLVEDISLSDDYASENFRVIGSFYPPTNVTNYVEGRIRLTQVWQSNDRVLDIIRPRIRDFKEYGAFGILVLDPLDNKVIAFGIGARPQVFDFQDRGGMAPRLNYTGICQVTIFGQEALEAIQAA